MYINNKNMESFFLYAILFIGIVGVVYVIWNKTSPPQSCNTCPYKQ